MSCVDCRPIHSFTIDVEDWFCVQNLRGVFPFDSWPDQAPRVEENTEKILALLKKKNIHATFFVLGWIAERHPELVKKIVAQGHEVGVHGYAHDLLYDLTPESFARDLDRALNILSPLVPNGELRGYRAPSFSLNAKTLWAVDILRERGFSYDSSVFPFSGHPTYGFPKASRHPFKFKNGLLEAPLPTARFSGFLLPFAGGGYLRLYPYSFTAFLWRSAERESLSVISYLHPWELDPDQPRVKNESFSHRFRHYVGLKNTQGRIEQLLNDFKFAPLWEVLDGQFISNAS